MNYKTILIFSVVIMLLSMTAVSAAENDDLTTSDNVEVQKLHKQ